MIPYEAMLEHVYRSLLKPGDVAIDIGAHTGRHTVPLAQAVGPTGKVMAFEPLPQSFQTLQNRVAPLGWVSTHRLALGETPGRTDFTVVPDFPEYSGFQKRTYHAGELRTETITVEVRRLDEFRPADDRVRFIKVDAEGGELLILRGGRALIEAAQPVVSFELGNASLVNYPYRAGDFFDFFTALDYRVFSIFGLPLDRPTFVDMTQRQFFWDYVALPRGETWFFDHGVVELMVQSAEAELASVTNSRAWRVTAPLRRAMDAVKRLRRRPPRD